MLIGILGRLVSRVQLVVGDGHVWTHRIEVRITPITGGRPSIAWLHLEVTTHAARGYLVSEDMQVWYRVEDYEVSCYRVLEDVVCTTSSVAKESFDASSNTPWIGWMGGVRAAIHGSTLDDSPYLQYPCTMIGYAWKAGWYAQIGRDASVEADYAWIL